jgi:hypothetical protein
VVEEAYVCGMRQPYLSTKMAGSSSCRVRMFLRASHTETNAFSMTRHTATHTKQHFSHLAPVKRRSSSLGATMILFSAENSSNMKQ